MTVCSNGFLWLDGTTTSTDFSPTEAELLSQAARIAPLWADLYAPGAPAGGGVFFNAVPAAAGAPARAVITWDRVPFYGNRAMLLSMQVILEDTGTIRVNYDATSQFYATPTVTGVSAGMGAVANPVDFSTQPLNSGSAPTIHESFRIGTAGGFDLGGVNQLWIPNGTNGYIVVQTPCPVAGFLRYGTGCPRNGTAYETFATNLDLANTSTRLMATPAGYVTVPGSGFDLGYASQIPGVGDDTIHRGLALGFTFPFEGTTVSAVDLSSNGYLWVASSATSDFSPTIAEFLGQSPRIAALWRDLNALTAGAVYWDATPAYAMATWIGVPNYSNATGTNDFQVKLFSNGDIELNYGTLDTGNPTNSAVTLVGITEGGNASDPGAVDFTAETPGLFIGAPGLAALSSGVRQPADPRRAAAARPRQRPGRHGPDRVRVRLPAARGRRRDLRHDRLHPVHVARRDQPRAARRRIDRQHDPADSRQPGAARPGGLRPGPQFQPGLQPARRHRLERRRVAAGLVSR